MSDSVCASSTLGHDEIGNVYRDQIAPWLPPRILDFHTHTWDSANWRERPWDGTQAGSRYMVVEPYYPPEHLLRDGQAAFPDRSYAAVCFGYPTPAVDWQKDTAYVAAAARANPCLRPLLLAGPALRQTAESYAQALEAGGFHGFKVFLNWYGDDYGNLTIDEMIGPVERRLANERRLIVLLHVPRSGRLADPEIQEGVRRLARECPDARIVLAHCGRCYLPSEMQAGIDCLRELDNVWMDTSMVMDPVVLQIAINAIGPRRLLFGTDFPVAAMRGRRVRVLDHWVDIVLPGYPESAWRMASADIRAGYMAWEIALAIRWAAELTGISAGERNGIFYDNGAALLQDPRRPASKISEKPATGPITSDGSV